MHILVCLCLGGTFIRRHHSPLSLAIVAVQSLENARQYFLLSIVSCDSLFPLLHDALQVYPIKVFYCCSTRITSVSISFLSCRVLSPFIRVGMVEYKTFFPL